MKFHFLTAPVKIFEKDGKVAGIESVKMDLKAFDSSGRRTPEPVEGSQNIVKVDMVIKAVGQKPDLTSLNLGDIKTDKSSRIIADPRTLATNVKGVFAGGDALTGPAIVIEAIEAGQRAASSIRDYLHGQELSPLVHRNGQSHIPVSSIPPTEEQTRPRAKCTYLKFLSAAVKLPSKK